MIKYGRQEIRAKLENKNYEGKLGKGAKFNYVFFLGQISFGYVYIRQLKI